MRFSTIVAVRLSTVMPHFVSADISWRYSVRSCLGLFLRILQTHCRSTRNGNWTQFVFCAQEKKGFHFKKDYYFERFEPTSGVSTFLSSSPKIAFHSQLQLDLQPEFFIINENCRNWVLTANWSSRIISIIAAVSDTSPTSARTPPPHTPIVSILTALKQYLSRAEETESFSRRFFNVHVHTTIPPPPRREHSYVAEENRRTKLYENKTCDGANKIYSGLQNRRELRFWQSRWQS